MATIGVRRPYVAKYNYDSEANAVTYSDGMVFAKAVDFGANIESASDNNLYADDGIAESDRSFSNGTLSVTIDDITQEASSLILGLTPEEITVDGKTSKELVFGDSMNVPDLGFGIIVSKMRGGVRSYRAIVFPKIKFSIPSDAATTQGENIEWQTSALEATITRDDTAGRNWKREATWQTEMDARAYIEKTLNITPEA